MWIILPKALDFDLIVLYCFSSNKWKVTKVLPTAESFLIYFFSTGFKNVLQPEFTQQHFLCGNCAWGLEKIQGRLGRMGGQRGPPRAPRGDIWEHQPWGLASHSFLWLPPWDVRFVKRIFLRGQRGWALCTQPVPSSMAIFKDSENDKSPKDGKNFELCFCNQWLANQWKRFSEDPSDLFPNCSNSQNPEDSSVQL